MNRVQSIPDRLCRRQSIPSRAAEDKVQVERTKCIGC